MSDERLTRDFPRANVTADIIILDTDGRILLIRRKKPPFQNGWALPGGFLDVGNETLEECAVREAREETGLDVELDTLVGVWSHPGRDPRGHTVTAAYRTRPVPREIAEEARGSDDAAEARWFKLDSPEFATTELAFDHREIVETALGGGTNI